MLTIAKAHAYGNDFLYVAEADVKGLDLPALARTTCDRHRGIGADGLIVERPTAEGARMWLYNSDGSPAEVSGNGVRGLAALIVGRGWPTDRPIVVDSEGGRKLLRFVGADNRRITFRAAMGEPANLARVTLDVAGERREVVTLWMGNPQCVCLGASLDDDTFNRVGAALERHPHFPHRTNVELVQVEAPGRIRIRIWERGAGPTESSGTGSCAAAVAAASFGGAGRDLEVVAPGGSQRVEWLADAVYLTGWAEVVMTGTWLG